MNIVIAKVKLKLNEEDILNKETITEIPEYNEYLEKSGEL